MPAPRLEGRVPSLEMTRVQAFQRDWCRLYGGTSSDAFRALVRLALDTAARPGRHDERWSEWQDALARLDVLVDALGRAVSATPALTAWLLAQAPDTRWAAPSSDVLAQSLLALLEADWDERCRRHGVPRARPAVRRPQPQPLGVDDLRGDAPAPRARQRLVATGVRLSPRDFERACAYAARVDLGRQAALAQLVQRGLDATDVDALRDDLDRLLDSVRRIEQRLELLGALATSPASVVLHLWRQLTGRSEEWERVLLHEVQAVAEATWHALRRAPAQSLPGTLALDPSDEVEGNGWPS